MTHWPTTWEEYDRAVRTGHNHRTWWTSEERRKWLKESNMTPEEAAKIRDGDPPTGPKFTVHIIRLADGAERPYSDPHCRGWSEDNEDFIWTDGNFACDCNRRLLFYRLANETAPDGGCGDHEFAIRVTDDATRGILYDDTEERRASKS